MALHTIDPCRIASPLRPTTGEKGTWAQRVPVFIRRLANLWHEWYRLAQSAVAGLRCQRHAEYREQQTCVKQHDEQCR